ncbi:MAG TPA: hypothetical protein VGM18_17870 [Candidatus Sulfotelmatobacter sp.]
MLGSELPPCRTTIFGGGQFVCAVVLADGAVLGAVAVPGVAVELDGVGSAGAGVLSQLAGTFFLRRLLPAAVAGVV